MSNADFAASLGIDSGGSRKSAGDYLKALKRRFWLVMLVGFLLGGAGVLFTLFLQRPVFLANAVVRIEAPRALVDGVNTGFSPAAAAGFFATRVEMIASRRVSEEVIRELNLSEWKELHGVEDPTAELMGWIKVKPRKNSNLVDVSLEGGDPQIVQRIVNSTVRTFVRFESDGLMQEGNAGSKKLRDELETARRDFQTHSQALIKFKRDNQSFLLGQKTAEHAQLELMLQRKTQLENEIESLRRKMVGLEALVKSGTAPLSLESQKVLKQIDDELAAIDEELAYWKWRLKPAQYERSAHVDSMNERKEKLEEQRQGVGKGEAEFELQQFVEAIKFHEAELAKMNEAYKAQQGRIVNQLPDGKTHDTLVTNELQARQRMIALTDQLARADAKPNLVQSAIAIEEEAVLPRTPIRPIFWLQIPLCIVAAMIFGCGLVVTLEMADATIREPEQARLALDWPLLGVLPRINRRELTTSHGKVMLGSELPGTQICEAFRNLRMSLVGAEGADRLRTMLVTSPKAGEGKSLTAANLAAAFARAGESVCLVDVDLRKPSIGDYFEVSKDAVGLVEVLEGAAPWTRALLETEIANLYVMPAGNADGVPADVLGTVEMHDLLGELSEKFDRVILDGPAILGLADARAVGRFVDGVLLVMRAGSHDPKPLSRVHQLFLHEGLRPAGFVFNGFKDHHDDFADNLPTVKRPTRSKSRSTEPVAVGTKAATIADDDADGAAIEGRTEPADERAA
jgi:succinoglycan biosynthesis transport protein ExoP